MRAIICTIADDGVITRREATGSTDRRDDDRRDESRGRRS